MSFKVLDTPSLTKRSSIGSVNANSRASRPVAAPISQQQERALIDACTCGDASAVSSTLARLQDHQSSDLEELVGYAFACAAGAGHVHVLELLLLSSGPVIRQSLRHGMCCTARLFAPRPFFHCRFALRYVAFAAVVSVEQRALASLEWLTARHSWAVDEDQNGDAEGEDEAELLMDADVMRSFRLAFTLACGSFASSAASTSQPEQFRPLLMLLLSRYPKLLLPLVHSSQPVHELLLTEISSSSSPMDDTVTSAARALRSSLLYEYTVNSKRR